MIRGEPYIQPLDIPADLRVSHITVQEMNLREFYALLIDAEHRCYLISYDNYRLIELPAESYEWNQTSIRIYGDLFFRNVMCVNDSGLTCLVSNREYQPVNRFQESWRERYDRYSGNRF